MKLPEISTKIKRLASLDMPVEALKALFLDLAVELDLEEARLSKDRARKPPEIPRNPVEIPAGSADIPRLAPVVDTTPSSLTSQESKEKENLTVFPKAASSKPLPSEPEAFGVFWEKYPKRAGNANRKGALKAFNAARKRVDLQDLFDGADAYRVHCEESGIIKTQFVQQARSWLNADGWTETYESKPNGQHPKLSSVDRAEAELLADIDEHWRRKNETEAIDVHGGDIASDVSRLRQDD